MRVSNIVIAMAAGIYIAAGIAHFSATRKSEGAHEGRKVFVCQPGVLSSHSLPVPVDSPPRAVNEPDVQSEAEKLLAADPEDTDGHFAALLDSLCRAGQFQTALKLAGEAASDLQPGLLKIVFNRWAQSNPLEALKSLDAIPDPQLHSAALRATVGAWDPAHSGDLATYAFALSAGDDRDYALSTALSNWSLQDPAALGTWLNTLPRGDEYDHGVSLMIQKTDGANRSPEIAMEWVESVTNPALKQDLLLRVLDEWAQNDSAAARQYVANAAWLDDSQRQQAMERVSNVRL